MATSSFFKNLELEGEALEQFLEIMEGESTVNKEIINKKSEIKLITDKEEIRKLFKWINEVE